jgi:hypothetical protein
MQCVSEFGVFSTTLAMKKCSAIYKFQYDLDISKALPRTKNLSPSFYVLFDTNFVRNDL